MTAGFIAGVLEGFEGTLDAVLEQLTDRELRCEVEALQDQIATKRQQFEEQDAIEAPLQLTPSMFRTQPDRQAWIGQFIIQKETQR